LSWDDAKDFSEAKNSTLPIITDKNIDNVFQRFIDDDSSGVVRNSSVWLGARARQVNESDWHWIDGHKSGIYTQCCEIKLNFHYSDYNYNLKLIRN